MLRGFLRNRLQKSLQSQRALWTLYSIPEISELKLVLSYFTKRESVIYLQLSFRYTIRLLTLPLLIESNW